MIKVNISQPNGGLKLLSAMLFYGTRESELTSMTQHPVKLVNGVPKIMQGTIASNRSLEKIGHAILNKPPTPLRFVAGNVLAMGDQKLIWWVPAGPQRMFFKAHAKGLENVNGVLPNPACVFALINDEWYVFAIAGNDRPTPETPLLASPYFNVWDKHNICVGSTVKPTSLDPDAWTAAFFASAFTHSNFRYIKNELNRRGGRNGLWHDLLKGKLKKFPINSLPQAGMTLGEFLERVNGQA